MSKHVVISTGYRKDQPPRGVLWCLNCGETEGMRLPDEVNVVLLRGRQFSKRHKACGCLAKTDEQLVKGYHKYHGDYVWGGFFSKEQIATAARMAASIELDGPPSDQHAIPRGPASAAAVLWLIENPKEGPAEFFSYNAAVFGFKTGRPENLWEEQRVLLFFKTARALLERKA